MLMTFFECQNHDEAAKHVIFRYVIPIFRSKKTPDPDQFFVGSVSRPEFFYEKKPAFIVGGIIS